MKEFKGAPALDAGLISAASCRALRDCPLRHPQDLGEELGHSEEARLLDRTLSEEKNTDATLTQLAETAANQKAEAA